MALQIQIHQMTVGVLSRDPSVWNRWVLSFTGLLPLYDRVLRFRISSEGNLLRGSHYSEDYQTGFL